MQFGVAECVHHWGRYRPNDIALRINNETVTYQRLNNHAHALCRHLRQYGVEQGSRIAIAHDSKYCMVVSVLAILQGRCSAVVLHHGLEQSDLSLNLKESCPKFILYGKNFDNYAKQCEAECGGKAIPLSDDLFSGGVECAPAHFSEWADHKDEWGVLFSSGTTDTSKAIVRDHYSMVTEHLGWCLELGLRRGTEMYIGRPLFYTGGLVLTMSCLTCGATTVCDDYSNHDDAGEVWSRLSSAALQTSLDVAFFTPDQLVKFTRFAEQETLKRPLSKTILVMGAKITGEEKTQAAKALSCGIIESWGNSESLGTITDPEDLSLRPNSIGRPFLSDDLFILDEEGNELGKNKLGRIAGGQEAGFNEYANRPEDTEEAKPKDVIRSGDIGWQDENGYFYFKCRSNETFCVAGSTICIPDVESTIRGIGDVSECGVFVQGDPAQLIAVVELIANHSVDPKDLLTLCNERLKPHAVLTHVEVVKELPKLPTGKLDRRNLAAEVKRNNG
jgi:acyl-coenzyme A synthetase/AMP-(fatty) acid ligase